MAAAIIAIIAAVVPLIVWIIRRKLAETPKDKLPQTYDAVSKDVASGNADAVNTRIDDVLNRLRAGKSNPGGQSGGSSTSK